MDITCSLVDQDYRGSVFMVSVSSGPLAWSRRFWEDDLVGLIEVSSARLNGEDGGSIPNWRYDKYPDQQHPELYGRGAPGIAVDRQDEVEDHWIVTIEDDSMMAVTMTTGELSMMVDRLRDALGMGAVDLSDNAYMQELGVVGHRSA